MVLYRILGVTDIILGSNVAEGAIFGNTGRQKALAGNNGDKLKEAGKTSQLLLLEDVVMFRTIR